MNKKQMCAAAIHTILGNQEASPIQVEAELNELIEELIQEEPGPAKAAHWPGMYEPGEDETYYMIGDRGFLNPVVNGNPKINAFHRCVMLSSSSQKEAEFVREHQKATLTVIKELAKLNGGWRPDWANDEWKYEPQYNRGTMSIEITSSSRSSCLPDWFQSKSKKIWEQVIKNIGEEKVELALWPVYEEGK